MQVIEQFPGHNQIEISEDVLRDFPGNVVVNGKGNRVGIGRPQVCSDIYVEVSGEGFVDIGKDCILTGQHVRLFVPGKIIIGSGCAFNGVSYLHMHESATIQLGKNCLIAGGVSFSASHVHKILDKKTGARLNPPGDVIIGDHVWVSADASLWPGTNIGNDSVVGRDAYVAKAFPPNCIVAGTPGRVIREGITWEA